MKAKTQSKARATRESEIVPLWFSRVELSCLNSMGLEEFEREPKGKERKSVRVLFVLAI